MRTTVFLFFCILKVSNSAPLDSCSRVDSCSECVNATDGFGFRCQWCSTTGSCASEQTTTTNCHVDDWTLDEYNCPMDVSKINYDESFMRNTVLPLIAATHAPSYDKTTCFAYSAYLKDRNAMVLSFRGTTTLFQLIDEGISFFLHPKIQFNVTKGVVDGYYLNAFYDLWNKGIKVDVERILREKEGVKIWFFGHSLGGGLASIASSYVAKTYELDGSRTKLVTFGMPRIGDIDLAEAHDQLVPDSWRIEHSKDPIPALPPRTFPDDIDKGSFHHNTEIWYPHGMALGANFEIGSRPDTTVGRSVFPFNIEDHFTYFNVYLESWYRTGCNVAP
uniref:Lipase_3 domain-containing protein n=1 Tax=Caenorhabditis tropicalis TaxID=1561998 RepID=A0A1I7T7J4_9PELO